jgi:nicotinamidase-related amidase
MPACIKELFFLKSSDGTAIIDEKIVEIEEPRIVSSKSSLGVLLIDMQDNFLEYIEDKEKKKLIKNQIGIIYLCEVYDIPLIFLEYEGNGRTIGELQEAAQKVRVKIALEKSYDDGFANTDLADKLRALSIDTLLLMGINASACVKRTGGCYKKWF